MKCFCRREDIRVKGQNAACVVDADGQISFLATVHDEFLDCAAVDLEWVRELCEIENKLEFNGFVDL